MLKLNYLQKSKCT